MRLRRHSSVKSDWKCPVQMYGSEKRQNNVITLCQILRTVVASYYVMLKQCISHNFYTFFTWKTTSLSKTGAQDLAVYIMDLETAIHCKKMRAL